MECTEFCTKVVDCLRRATRREREDIAVELAGHVEDHMETLTAAGYEAGLAEARAVAAMGEPEEIARALDAQLSPFWLWVGRVCKAAVVLLCLFQITEGDLLGGVREDVGMWRRWKTAQEAPWTLRADVASYPVAHRLDIRVPIGNDVLYVYQVNVSPVEHLASVEMVTYDQAGPGNMVDLHRYITVESQGETPQEPVYGGWGGAGPWYIRHIRYAPGDTYLTLRYDRFGEQIAIPVPLYGEVAE